MASKLTTAAVEAAFAEAMKRVVSAKTTLVLNAPYFGALALNIKYKCDPTCKTAWVDGRVIGFSPKFVAGLDNETLVTLIAHEVLHPALGHPWRRGDRDHYWWNVACDKVINRLLLDAGFKLPANVFVAEGDEIGKSAEWIYAHDASKRAEQEAQKRKEKAEQEQEQEDGEGQPGDSGDEGEEDEDGDGQGPDGQPGEAEDGDGTGQPGDQPGNEAGEGDGDDNPFGEVRDAPAGADEDGDDAPSEQEWKDSAVRAAATAKGQGRLPGGMERAIKDAIKPVVDVKTLLLRFCEEQVRSDYSWKRPNKRYRTQGLYLPSLHGEGLGEIAFMCDTSGSMGDEALARSQGIIQEVIDELEPAGVTVVYADDRVARVDRFEQGEPLVWRAKGGGGTSFIPALEYIDEELDPVCIVCLTDMEGDYPDTPPGAPVLWLNLSRYKHMQDFEAPFGETVFADFR